MTAYQQLVVRRMTMLVVPRGATVGSVVETITDKKLPSIASEADAWVKKAIQTIRYASEPNPYKTADDETIGRDSQRNHQTF